MSFKHPNLEILSCWDSQLLKSLERQIFRSNNSQIFKFSGFLNSHISKPYILLCCNICHLNLCYIFIIYNSCNASYKQNTITKFRLRIIVTFFSTTLEQQNKWGKFTRMNYFCSPDLPTYLESNVIHI